MGNKTNYFTAGELASLFGITKQTLLYYDKVKLLHPEYVGENGYRNYTLQQCLTLEMIITLRKLDVSIADIKEFLEDKNKDNLLKVLEKKEEECIANLAFNQNIIENIKHLKSGLTKDYSNLTNRITLSWKEEKYYKISSLSPSHTGKDRIAIFARHTDEIYNDATIVDKKVGWLVPSEDFFAEEPKLMANAFFSFCHTTPPMISSFSSSNLTTNEPVPKSIYAKFTEGFYIEMYFSGTFHEQALHVLEKFRHFIANNQLHIDSNLYVLPVENHWLSPDSQKYISKAFIKVRYTDD